MVYLGVLKKYKKVSSLNLCPYCKSYNNTIYDGMMRCFLCREEYKIKTIESHEFFDEDKEDDPIICISNLREMYYRIEK